MGVRAKAKASVRVEALRQRSPTHFCPPHSPLRSGEGAHAACEVVRLRSECGSDSGSGCERAPDEAPAALEALEASSAAAVAGVAGCGARGGGGESGAGGPCMARDRARA